MNTVTWMIQVSAIALLGCALPWLFRIRHARLQLAFYHIVLIACILLPLIEPWYHPLQVVTAGGGPPAAVAPVFQWAPALRWLLVLGVLARLGWLLSGYFQIRRFRRTSTAIPAVMESIRHARHLTCSDARFALSNRMEGPATFGYLDPVVLLPETFLTLEQDAQLSIACHELLHVKRNDWIVTMLEEIAAALFWFSPALWLLISQIRLSREQLVDSEVVLLTAAPAPYVQALLAMAGAVHRTALLPAAGFLSHGHLANRIRRVLSNQRRSRAGLWLSSAVAALVMLVMSWLVVMWLPLVGEAETVEAFAQQRRSPPILKSWQDTLKTVPQRHDTFTVKVPPPPALSPLQEEDRLYGVDQHMEAPFIPSFPGNMPGPAVFFIQRGVRMLRPGDVPTPEELLRLQDDRGDGSIVHIEQSPEGTIQRIAIFSRRMINENHSAPFNLNLAADAADGVH